LQRLIKQRRLSRSDRRSREDGLLGNSDILCFALGRSWLLAEEREVVGEWMAFCFQPSHHELQKGEIISARGKNLRLSL
jgi:hypothetical protein